MIEGIIGAVKALSVSIVLNNVENQDKDHAYGLLKDKTGQVAKVTKLENDFTNYKDKYQIQVGLVIENDEKDMKIDSLKNKAQEDLQTIDDLRNKQKALYGEKKSLEDALKVANAQGENEPEKLADLDYAGLITKVKQLEKFLLEGAHHGFNNGVAQVKAIIYCRGPLFEGKY